MINRNIDLSVVKRRTDEMDEVVSRLEDQGFDVVSDRGMGVTLESEEGISLCVYDGVFGTWVTPSGPVRGRVFSERAVGFGMDRVVDTNNDNNNNNNNNNTRNSNNNRGSSSNSNVLV